MRSESQSLIIIKEPEGVDVGNWEEVKIAFLEAYGSSPQTLKSMDKLKQGDFGKSESLKLS